LKKFDKTAGWKASTLYTQKINKYHWVSSNKIDEFLHDTEVKDNFLAARKKPTKPIKFYLNRNYILMNLQRDIEEEAWRN
jgi:hypothetical protein